MQRTLESGVSISPKSIIRQRKLGDAAFKNNDVATAERAYEKIVEEKHGSEFQLVDMATLARSYLQRSDVQSAKNLLDNQRTFLSNTNEGKMIASVTMADISYKSGDVASSKRHIAEAIRAKKKLAHIDSAIVIDLIGVCLKNSMDEVATSIGTELLQTTTLKKEELERLQDLFREAGIESSIPNETPGALLNVSREAHKKTVE
jgi:ATP/maltotriose-dependent transcriptional regulator MalT